MFRRRKKLYFQNTVSKFPAVIFVASVIIGGFFLFKIIATLVKETEPVTELAPIEIKVETKNKAEAVSIPKETAPKSAESPKPVVKTPVGKSAETTAKKERAKTPQLSEFYTVQVATFTDMRRTENLTNQLKESKYSPVYIKTRDKLFEVCIGKFSDPKDGQEVLLKIRKSFHDAFIRKIQPPFEEK